MDRTGWQVPRKRNNLPNKRGKYNSKALSKDTCSKLFSLQANTSQTQSSLLGGTHFHTHWPRGLDWEFFKELVGRGKELVSIPNVSSSHISISTAATFHIQAKDLHAHVRNVFGFSWAPGAFCNTRSWMMDAWISPRLCIYTTPVQSQPLHSPHKAHRALPQRKRSPFTRQRCISQGKGFLPALQAKTTSIISSICSSQRGPFHTAAPATHAATLQLPLSLMQKAALNSLPLNRGSVLLAGLFPLCF